MTGVTEPILSVKKESNRARRLSCFAKLKQVSYPTSYLYPPSHPNAAMATRPEGGDRYIILPSASQHHVLAQLSSVRQRLQTIDNRLERCAEFDEALGTATTETHSNLREIVRLLQEDFDRLSAKHTELINLLTRATVGLVGGSICLGILWSFNR